MSTADWNNTYGARSIARKNAGVEMLRGLLALTIVFYHYLYVGPLAGKIEGVPVGHLASYGRYAVGAFFVVSGFVIAFSAESGNWAKFAASRISRLLPAALVCATVSFIAMALSPFATADWVAWGSSATLLPLLFGASFVDFSYWSIIVEMQFYALVAVLLLARADRLLLPILTTMAIAGAAMLIFDGGRFYEWRPLTHYAALFAVGYLFHKAFIGRLNLWLSAALFLNVVLAGIALGYEFWRLDFFPLTPEPLLRGMLVICAIVVLVWGAIILPVPAWLAGIAGVLGGVSYPLYLLHQEVGYALIGALQPVFGSPVSVALTTMCVFAMAWSVFVFVERRFAPRLRPAFERKLKVHA